MLGVTFVPLKYDKTKACAYNPVALSSLPTTYIDASSCSAVEMVYPWCLPFGKDIPAKVADSLGHIVIWVLDPLVCETAPGQTTSIAINIEANFDNPMLHDPDPASSSVPAPPARVANTMQAGTFAYAQSSGVRREAMLKAEKGTISAALDCTSKIASTVSHLPVIGDFASGLAVATKAASTAFDFLGLAKPPNLTTPLYVTDNPLPYSTCLDGVTTAEPLSVEQVPFVATEPSFLCSDNDETSFVRMASKPFLKARFVTGNVPTDTPVLLGVIPVSPQAGWVTNPNLLSYSPLGVVAASFRNWRGSLSYKFIVPANPLTRIRLAIMYSLTKTATFTEQNRYMYVDVEGTTVIDAVIPWTRKEPFMNLPFATLANVTTAVANGYIHIFQVSNLIADSPSVSPTPLSILAFCAGADDLQFAVPQPVVPGNNLSVGTAFPNGFLGLERSIKIDRLLAEDNVHSIRQLMHRIYNDNQYIIPKNTAFFPNIVIPVPHAFYLYMFRYWRGSVTYTLTNPFEPGNTCKQIVISPNDNQYDDNEIIWYPDRQPRIQVIVPFVNLNGYYLSGGLESAVPIRSLQLFATDVANDFKVNIGVSFNDDLSVGVPQPPRFVVLT
jgi:hypothetical protein